MNFARQSMLAALIISCAARAPVPAVSPRVEVPKLVQLPELTPIAPEQCTPRVEGYALSKQGVVDLATGIRSRLAECGKRIIEVTQERDTLHLRADELNRDLGASEAWALTGKIGVGVVVVLTVVAAVFIGKSAVQQ